MPVPARNQRSRGSPGRLSPLFHGVRFSRAQRVHLAAGCPRRRSERSGEGRNPAGGSYGPSDPWGEAPRPCPPALPHRAAVPAGAPTSSRRAPGSVSAAPLSPRARGDPPGPARVGLPLPHAQGPGGQGGKTLPDYLHEDPVSLFLVRSNVFCKCGILSFFLALF